MSKEQREKKEEEFIEQAYKNLLNDYLASPHSKKVDLINKAYSFSKNAHKGIRRLSGEAYILHPIAVAHIACKEIGLGSTSICAALLHDVVEDTDYTIDDIRDIFGDKIAQIVDGLTKISGGVFGEQASAQAENFRKLIITMSEDIRVILIKIADRLHNMRTLDSQPTAKQYKIAGETEYIYAPLAHRLGLFSIKSELENLSFKYNFPKDYNFIEERLIAEKNERMAMYDRFSLPIMNRLNSFGYQFIMKERIKSVYSIWNKMQNKHLPFEEIFDILGARIVFTTSPGADEKLECWKIYNIITQIYTPHPERTRDWLSTPKANGYEALHVTVMGPDGFWIEVQIRSKRMDEIAEMGLAAHWNYKKDYTSSESKIEEWLNTVNELLKNPDSDAMLFLDSFKLTLFDTEIFVFTPKGELKTIPAGSTALDFAFEIHSDIGTHCIGAKVNNKLVPLSHVLKSGDQVEILTAKHQTPSESWLGYVSTAKAKEKLFAILKQSARTVRAKGDEIIRNRLTSLGYNIKKDYPNDIIKRLLYHYKQNSLDSLLTAVGKGELNLDNLSDAVKNKRFTISYWTPNFLRPKVKDDKKPEESNARADNSKSEIAEERQMSNGEHIIAACCKPIPGDDIIGFINKNGQIVVHKRNCKEALRLKSQRGSKIVTVEWTYKKEQYYTALIEIQGIDRKKMLSDIVNVISIKMEANIKKLTVSTLDGIFDSKVNIYISHVDDIKRICSEIRKIDGVESVSRIEE